MRGIWKEGSIIDFWSLNHFLFGATLVLVLRKLKLHFWQAFAVAAVTFIFWEVFEVILKVAETSVNHLMDIVVAMAGFLLFWAERKQNYFKSIIPVYVILEVWGYLTMFGLASSQFIEIQYLVYIAIVVVYGVYCYFVQNSMLGKRTIKVVVPDMGSDQ